MLTPIQKVKRSLEGRRLTRADFIEILTYLVGKTERSIKSNEILTMVNDIVRGK